MFLSRPRLLLLLLVTIFVLIALLPCVRAFDVRTTKRLGRVTTANGADDGGAAAVEPTSNEAPLVMENGY